jgi:hypothetical protein
MSYGFYKSDNEREAVVSAITANALKETTQDADGPVVYQCPLYPEDLNSVARWYVLI